MSFETSAQHSCISERGSLAGAKNPTFVKRHSLALQPYRTVGNSNCAISPYLLQSSVLVKVFPRPTVMSDVTQILSRIESGDPSAAEQLMPLVYDELRKLAAAKL